MTGEDLCEELERRAPGEWELYRKTADTHELTVSSEARSAANRQEEGWAARWWEGGHPRFACACEPARLSQAMADAARVRFGGETPLSPPDWPAGKNPFLESAAAPAAPDLFEALQRLLSAESRGEAQLGKLVVRGGASSERVQNARGLDISQRAVRTDGIALAIGRRGARACEARVVFRWDGPPELEALARRLTDRATLPLSDRATPIPRGEWLLDPSVTAALLAAVAPLFVAERLPPSLTRNEFCSAGVTLVDDAAADAPYDGEGTPTRRVLLTSQGRLSGRLHDLSSAKKSGEPPTGHGVRPSYRMLPAAGPRRLFLETAAAFAPQELLRSVRRGLFASALLSPIRLDLDRDRYEVEFTGVALTAGRAQGPVAGARASGRLSQLLHRVAAVSTDRQFFPMPYPVGAPTVLIERSDFE